MFERKNLFDHHLDQRLKITKYMYKIFKNYVYFQFK